MITQLSLYKDLFNLAFHKTVHQYLIKCLPECKLYCPTTTQSVQREVNTQ